MGAIRTIFFVNTHIMDLHSTDPKDASGTKLAHLIVEQGPPADASQPSSSSSSTPAPAPAPSTSTRIPPTRDTSVSRNRRFVCTYPECDKTFTTSGHLARHIRVHTGEKAFQCTFPNCESRFSRHDNMLQHYRNHIVRNARRRKKAFASAVANGSVGITGNVPYDDDLKAMLGAGRSQAATPTFIHSAYSTLSQQLATTSTGQARRQNPVNQQHPDLLYPSEPMLHASTSSISGRNSSMSPVLAPQLHPSSASSRPSYLSLSSRGPRDPAFATSFSAHSSSTSYTHLSPPLASPSVMDRPHTATTSFFPLAIEAAPLSIQPPTLTHRHSYSALGNQPVLEPITPTSELPHYPYHQYPASPAPMDPRELYSPTLTASPHLVAGVDTPSSEISTYFQPVHGSGPPLYPDRYGPPQPRVGASATYPPSHSQSHSVYLSHPQTSSVPFNPARTAVSHSSLGSHNPLLSGLDLGQDTTLSNSSRSTSIASSSAQYLAPPSHQLITDSAQYTSQLSASAPTARWLRDPNARSEYPQYTHGHNFGQSPGWQPEMRANYPVASTGQPIPYRAASTEEAGYSVASSDEQGYDHSGQQHWTTYESST